MITLSKDNRTWTFYEEDEPVSVTIYKPCTDHRCLFLIVEEPTEGGASVELLELPKELVAAAFCLTPEEIDTEDYVEKHRGFAVTIPQVLHDWKSGKYYIGVLGKISSGEWIVASSDPNDSRSIIRQEVVAHLLRDKTIWERINMIKNSSLPF